MISKFPPCILSVTLSDRALTLTASPHLMQIVAVFYVFHPPIRHALKRNTIEIAVFTLLVGTLFKNALHHPHPCLSSCSSLCSMVVEIGIEMPDILHKGPFRNVLQEVTTFRFKEFHLYCSQGVGPKTYCLTGKCVFWL